MLEGPDGLRALERGTSSSKRAARTGSRNGGERALARRTMLDAPVSGGKSAPSRERSIIGGRDAGRSRRSTDPHAMGIRTHYPIGDSGRTALQVCNQMVIGGALAVVSEASRWPKAGIDPAKVRGRCSALRASRVLECRERFSEQLSSRLRTALYARIPQRCAALSDTRRGARERGVQQLSRVSRADRGMRTTLRSRRCCSSWQDSTSRQRAAGCRQ